MHMHQKNGAPASLTVWNVHRKLHLQKAGGDSQYPGLSRTRDPALKGWHAPRDVKVTTNDRSGRANGGNACPEEKTRISFGHRKEIQGAHTFEH
jgi:hypothetical protein